MLKGTDNVSFGSFLRDLTYNEIHLFWMGLYAGFVAPRPKPKHEPSERMKKALNWSGNMWYWQTAFVVGYILKVIVGVVAGASLSGILPL